MLARINVVKDRLFLAGIMAGALFFVPGAFALGLGEITLSSSLDEPLDASIELLETGDLNEDQIVIELGSADDYARVDLDRPAFLSGIRFDVELDGDTGTIHLTSTGSVTEPFLNLIVSARWPNGRFQREYTVLVDLPAFTNTPAMEPELPAATGVAEDATPPAQPTPQTTAQAPAAESASPAQADSYTIASGDSLWEIAREIRPDESVTVQQTMLAIQRVNQNAFLDNNINRVITGRVLRIPTLQEIQVVDQTSAVTQVSLQNSQLGVQPLAGAGGNGNRGALQDELSVLTNDPDAVAEGSSDLAATIAALENELLISEENLDRARLENQELNARLSILEEEINLLENIVALEDQRIAQLQAELATQSAATAEALAQAQEAIDALNALETASVQPQGLLARVLEILQNNLVWIGIMVALVLGVVGLLVIKSRRDEEAAEAYAFDPVMPGQETAHDAIEAEGISARPGMLAGVMTRFRRDDNAADDFEDVVYTGQGLAGDVADPAPVGDLTGELSMPHHHGIDVSEDVLHADAAVGAADGVDSFTARDEEALADLQDGDSADELVSDMAAAEAAMAAMDAEAEQAAARDLAEEESAMPDAADPSDDDTVFDARDLESIAFTPLAVPDPDAADFADSADSEESEETREGSPFEEDTETFEFTLRDHAEEAEETDDIATADLAGTDADELEKFDFKLQDTDASEAMTATAAAGSEVASSGPDSLLEFGDFSFDDSMLPDDDDNDYLAHHDLDECDTKLDLATAYEAMGDVEDAIDILNEVIAEGNQTQIETAERLKQSWQSA